MGKKGQSISINTIIIAAIALAVLVVLFVIFTGRIGIFTKGVQETDTCAQKCNSLNMVFAGAAPQEKRCDPSPPNSYIPGVYKDGENGCCCSPK